MAAAQMQMEAESLIDEGVISADDVSMKEAPTGCQVKRAVGIAGGKRKLSAIRGALRGRLINVLITDRFTAQDLLQMEGITAQPVGAGQPYSGSPPNSAAAGNMSNRPGAENGRQAQGARDQARLRRSAGRQLLSARQGTNVAQRA